MTVHDAMNRFADQLKQKADDDEEYSKALVRSNHGEDNEQAVRLRDRAAIFRTIALMAAWSVKEERDVH